MTIVAFSGHRPNKLGGYKLPNPTYNLVCQKIEKELIQLAPAQVISGMALGVDQWAANIALKLKIPFIAAVPFIGQEKAWPKESQLIYQKLLKYAAETIIVSPGNYDKYKMQIRNEWMVNKCDVLIAVYNGDKSGGTANCVNYAKSLNKNIIYIDPTI